jgi:hypothetical protein
MDLEQAKAILRAKQPDPFRITMFGISIREFDADDRARIAGWLMDQYRDEHDQLLAAHGMRRASSGAPNE